MALTSGKMCGRTKCTAKFPFSIFHFVWVESTPGKTSTHYPIAKQESKFAQACSNLPERIIKCCRKKKEALQVCEKSRGKHMMRSGTLEKDPATQHCHKDQNS
jgi:hypothetical protein